MDVDLAKEKKLEVDCDKLDLSTFFGIQPHGVLFVLRKKDLHVLQYSSNIQTVLNIAPSTTILDQPITKFLTSKQNVMVDYDWLQHANKLYKRMYWRSEGTENDIWVYVQQLQKHIILEIERILPEETEYQLFNLSQNAILSMQVIQTGGDVQQLAQNVCREIQKLTGFDRVVIYQFDSAWNGTVLGEATQKDMEPFLNLKFPATDLPKGVRDNYINQPLRYIPTIYYQPAKLIPENTFDDDPLQGLTNTLLKEVAPVHIKYMTNMGIVGTTSVGIIYEGKLWGIIACHHRQPKYLPVYLRLILVFYANSLSTQLALIEQHKKVVDEKKTLIIQEDIANKLAKEHSLVLALSRSYQDLLEMVNAQGMALFFMGDLVRYGKTPSETEIQALINWLADNPRFSVTYATDRLPQEYEPSKAFVDSACGLLVIPITSELKNYLLFFRPEIINTISWAGNPQTILRDESAQYSPRSSFKIWLQQVGGHSLPWLPYEVKAAEILCVRLINKEFQLLLEAQAMHDPLTGLLNRRSLEQTLTHELIEANREHQQIALFMIDIDFFKSFNDQYGHLAGDAILIAVANFLKKNTKEEDYLFRYGGEEFLVLLHNITLELALKKAELLRNLVKELELVHQKVRLPKLSISIGVAISSEKTTNIKMLISSADSALYNAKKKGRDRVEYLPEVESFTSK